MWHSKFMAWLEQKLIDVTTKLYIKRREVLPVAVEQTAPTMEPAPAVEPVVKKRTFVKRTEPKITKAAPTKKTSVKAPKQPAAKKPATKKPATKKAAAKPVAKKPTTKTRKAAK